MLDLLHAIAPRSLECTCWRPFAAQWGDCKKSQTVPLNVLTEMCSWNSKSKYKSLCMHSSLFSLTCYILLFVHIWRSKTGETGPGMKFVSGACVLCKVWKVRYGLFCSLTMLLWLILVLPYVLSEYYFSPLGWYGLLPFGSGYKYIHVHFLFIALW